MAECCPHSKLLILDSVSLPNTAEASFVTCIVLGPGITRMHNSPCLLRAQDPLAEKYTSQELLIQVMRNKRASIKVCEGERRKQLFGREKSAFPFVLVKIYRTLLLSNHFFPQWEEKNLSVD